MGTIRRSALSALDRIEVDAQALRLYIEVEMDYDPTERMLDNYLARARHLRQSLDYLDKQLSGLKDLT